MNQDLKDKIFNKKDGQNNNSGRELGRTLGRYSTEVPDQPSEGQPQEPAEKINEDSPNPQYDVLGTGGTDMDNHVSGND